MNRNEINLDSYVFGIELEGSENHVDGLEISYPIQVVNMYDDTIVDNFGMTRGYEQLRGMPIEVEHLKKNGWVLVDVDPEDKSECWEYSEDNVVLSYWFPTKKVEFGLFCADRRMSKEHNFYHMVKEMPMNFVHELQDMMVRCGVKKQFILNVAEL